MYLGAHMSIAGGIHNALLEGASIGCTAVQLFTKSNNRWQAPPLKDAEIEQFNLARSQTGIDKLVVHAGYLINLANPSENWQKSMDSMETEFIRAEQLGLESVVLHPGSHLGEGEEYGLKRIADSLNQLYAKHPSINVKTLLEVTAGQGTNLGYTFEQLAAILDMADDPGRYGICLDTCHMFAAGYDLRTGQAYEKTMDHFDTVLGISRVMAIHLNDTHGELGCKKDRHAHIGTGSLGRETFRLLLNDPRFADVPMVLETPKDDGINSDVANLDVLLSLVES